MCLKRTRRRCLKKLPFSFFAVVFLSAGLPTALSAAISVELTGGFSWQSGYQYVQIEGNTFNSWLEFTPVHAPSGLVKIGVNVFDSNFTLGFAGGFSRRFDLYAAESNSLTGAISRASIGSILSIPLFGFIENAAGPFYWEAGCGMFLTRMNFSDAPLPEFANTGIFGFLFGAGYGFELLPGLDMRVSAELFTTAPGVLFDLLPEALTNRYAASRNSSVLVWHDALVVWNFQAGISLRWRLAEGVKLL